MLGSFFLLLVQKLDPQANFSDLNLKVFRNFLNSGLHYTLHPSPTLCTVQLTVHSVMYSTQFIIHIQ